MNDAFEKNKIAVSNLFKKPDSIKLITESRIGIWSEGEEFKSGTLIAKALGELLGRFWSNIDINGVYSNVFIESATISARSCNYDSNIKHKWNPPYDFIIAIGTKLPTACVKGISIGADNWTVFANSDLKLTNNSIPVGPFGAAVLAAAEAFKVIFYNDQLSEEINFIPKNFSWNIWSNKNDLIKNSEIDLGEIHIFGVGAVSHGLFWVLNHWPHTITGKIHLIDLDKYDESNAQRYLGMVQNDLGKYKVTQMAEKLAENHPKLNIKTHNKDMNQYISEENPTCYIPYAVVGMDSIEKRRQLALKLPQKIVNMWTSDTNIGVTKHSFENSRACLYCMYDDDKNSLDETSQIHNELNKALSPYKIRDLLHSGKPLSYTCANLIAEKLNIDINTIINKPLSSIRSHLCATKTIQLPQSSVDTHVPFVFASGLVGMMGFTEIVRDACKQHAYSSIWNMPILKYPDEGCWKQCLKYPSCYLCSDYEVKTIIQRKYKS